MRMQLSASLQVAHKILKLNGNTASHNLKNKLYNRLMCFNASKHRHSSTKFGFVCFLNYRSVSQKNKKLLLLGVLRLNNGLAQVGLDGRAMSSSNAAVQQFWRDVNYLALELNLYISKLIGIGTGLDIKNSPPDAKPERCTQPYLKIPFTFK
jgi:hypothetical protein